jgi:hypothetical protein
MNSISIKFSGFSQDGTIRINSDNLDLRVKFL